jgi:hypothetical protein
MLSFHVFDSEELIGASSSQDEVLIEIIKYHLRSISTAKGLQTIESIDWNIKTS